jgi:hypothetical protein
MPPFHQLRQSRWFMGPRCRFHSVTFRRRLIIRGRLQVSNRCDFDVSGGSEYSNAISFPTRGSLELIIRQTYEAPYTSDVIFASLQSKPAGVSSTWRLCPFDNATYIGYAIRCGIDSFVDSVDLDAAKHTYSNFFSYVAAEAHTSLLGVYGLNLYPGVLATQSLVFGFFTTVELNIQAPAVCNETGGLGPATCNPWYSASIATSGNPEYIPGHDDPPVGNL